ncbi:MAG TPA: diguanylate cyclase [bacterium]|nr:diguanylate cyclase [bacterium]
MALGKIPEAADEDLRQQVVRLEALIALSQELRSANLVELYPIAPRYARDLLHADFSALTLADAKRETLTRVAASGHLEEAADASLSLADSLPGWVVRTGVMYLTEDVFREPIPINMSIGLYRGFGPLAIVPVRSEQQAIGALTLARRKTSDQVSFTDADLRLLKGIAEMTGTAIRRASLYQDLQQAFTQMVLAMAQAIESRDSTTGAHSARLATLATATAHDLGCRDDEIEELRWGARLHDIGKIGVPDYILQKPGPLTDEEWAIMRKHPEIGEEILRPVDRMRTVARLVRHHQERWDGTGYPDGLRGEVIPLGARILAVVDAYSAITDNRAYSEGRSAEHAIAELRRCAGTQFDPRVVDVFCRILREGPISITEDNRVDRTPGIQAMSSSGKAIVRSLAHARRASRTVPAMVDVVKHLMRPPDLATVLDEILGQIQRIFDYPICAVFLVDEKSRRLCFKTHRGFDAERVAALRAGAGEFGLLASVAKHGRPYFAPDVTRDPLYIANASGVRSMVTYPLVADDRVIGVLDVESPIVNAFPLETREMLEAFAALAALAIQRAVRDEALSQLALTDGLTGLANHRALFQALEREIARTRRTGDPLTLILIEVDKFKQINDRLGHLAGDAIVQSVADILRANSREMDLASRFGGDEFVLLLPNTTKTAAVQIAERVRQRIEEIPVAGSRPLRVTASVGLAAAPDDGGTASALVQAADQAMYEAKRSGGNRINVA